MLLFEACQKSGESGLMRCLGQRPAILSVSVSVLELHPCEFQSGTKRSKDTGELSGQIEDLKFGSCSLAHSVAAFASAGEKSVLIAPFALGSLVGSESAGGQMHAAASPHSDSCNHMGHLHVRSVLTTARKSCGRWTIDEPPVERVHFLSVAVHVDI